MENMHNNADSESVSIPINNGLTIELPGSSNHEGHIITIKAVGHGGGSCLVNKNPVSTASINLSPLKYRTAHSKDTHTKKYFATDRAERLVDHSYSSNSCLQNKQSSSVSGELEMAVTDVHKKQNSNGATCYYKVQKSALKRTGSTELVHPVHKKQWRNPYQGVAFSDTTTVSRNYLSDITSKKNLWCVPQQTSQIGNRHKKNNLNYVKERTETPFEQREKAMRQMNIQLKVWQPGPLNFTVAEEYDIQTRADKFITTVRPDPNYVLTGETRDKHLKEWLDIYPNSCKRQKRRHLTVNEKKLLVSSIDNSGPEYNSHITLDCGLTFLRPLNRLIELVAEAISDSPDGLLQVSHVYCAIKARYPYFQYMKPDYLSSWRSSIRHALYQKWFRKVVFHTILHSSKGCYWSLSGKKIEKEWKHVENTSLQKDWFSKKNNYHKESLPKEMVLYPPLEDMSKQHKGEKKCGNKKSTLKKKHLPPIEEEQLDCLCLNEMFTSQDDTMDMDIEENMITQIMSELNEEGDSFLMNGIESDQMFYNSDSGNSLDFLETINADNLWQNTENEEIYASNLNPISLENSMPVKSSEPIKKQSAYWSSPNLWTTSTKVRSKVNVLSSSETTLESAILPASFQDPHHYDQPFPDISVDEKDFYSDEKELCSSLESTPTDFSDMSQWLNIL